MARLRAVARSQATGLAGVPSRGQRSAATANACWAASSALSKSPRKPTSEASDAAPLLAEDLFEWGYGYSTSGRTSTDPPSRAAGTRAATSSAASTLSSSNR